MLNLQKKIEKLLASLEVLPGKEEKIPEYAYNLSIAKEALQKWEVARTKNPTRQLKSIRDNAIKLRNSVKKLPAQLRIHYGLDAISGLDAFLAQAIEAAHVTLTLGNKNKPVTEYLTLEAMKTYQDLTGQPTSITKETDTVQSSHFIVFLEALYGILEIKAPVNRALYYAKKAKK